MTTWRRLLDEAAQDLGERLTATTLSEDELNAKFDSSYGLYEGKPFTAWTINWVLFPVGYDGAEWVGWAPRNPSDIKTKHQGAGG